MDVDSINQRFIQVVDLLVSDKKETSIAAVMAKLGRKPSTHSEIKGGRQKVQLDIIQNFCSLYGVSLDYIFNGTSPVFKYASPAIYQADSTPTGGVSESENVSAYTKSSPINMPQVVTIDNSGSDNIVFVPIKARAGYLHGYGDPSFIGSLPAYRFPGVHNGTFRMFEIEGLSMHPTLNNFDIVICDWVQNFNEVRDERVYVVVTTEGIVVKRVINRIQSDDVLILKSDNIRNKEEYPTIILHSHEIKEIWYCRRKVSADFSAPGDLFNRMTNIEAELHLLKNEIRKKDSKGYFPHT